MRRLYILSLSLLLGGFLPGCGDDAPPFVPRDSGPFDAGPRPDTPRPDLGMGGDTGVEDADIDGGDPEACLDGPSVTIIDPVAATGPSDVNVLVGARHTVRCEVLRPSSADSRPVDPESVSILLVDAEGNSVASPIVSSEGMVFSAAFELGDQVNGLVRFICTAQDVDARCGRDAIETLLDLGPNVEINAPATGSIHASNMNLRYTITEAPVAAGDTSATVANHLLVVAGVTITDIVNEGEGVFSAAIDFTDDTLFDEALTGEFEIQLDATNSRNPEGATRVLRQPFTLDRTPPVIVFNSPDEGELVGGRVRVELEITDPAGIDITTLVLRAGMMEFDLRRTDSMTTYEAFFDASLFPSTVTELTLNVTASDNAANQQTASQIIKLDSTPPIASLDPPLVRDSRFRSGRIECSELFDPVGADSVNDGDVVGTATEFRVRTQDEGNQSVGGVGTVTFLSGLRSVQVYISDEPGEGLLVDSTGDGVCDSINPILEPMPGDPSRALVVDMLPIPPRGRRGFGVDMFGPPPGIFPIDGPYGDGVYDVCREGSGASVTTLCDSTEMTRVIASSYGEPTIYGKPPVTTMGRDGTCAGDAFDFQTALDEGWACLAVRSEDNLGNIGISPPIRVCFSDEEGDDPCSGGVIPAGFDCMASCTAPRSFVNASEYQLAEM